MGNKTKISKVSNDALGTLTVRIIEGIDASSVEAIKTSDYYTNCVQTLQNYRAANTRNEKKKYDAIDIEFQRRKEFYMQIRKYLQGLLISPDAETKNAAQRLFAVANRFGATFLKNRNADQSYNYNQIIAGLRNPDLLADIEALKLTEIVQQLETAHRSYETLYVQWGDFRNAALTASNLRSALELCIKNLLDDIEWLHKKTPSEELTNLRNSIHARIDEINLAKSKNTASPTNTDNASAA